MSSLADLPELVGFFSYSREDDADSQGALSALRNRIQGELRGQLGRTAKTFRLWQDKEAIPSGTLWESEITNSIEQAAFFIPIITPTVVASPYCRFELDAFLAREAALGRNDLVFPILYIHVPALEDSVRRQNDAALSLIAKRQYVDWREFRHLDSNSTEVKRAVERFCQHIRDALSKPWVSPDERKQLEEAVALERAEAERQRREAEAKRSSEEETRERAAEQERQKREAEAERTRIAALEAKAREEEVRRQRQAEVEQQRAEAERRKADERRLSEEAEAKRRAEAEEHRRLWRSQARPLWPPSRSVLAAGALLGVFLIGAIGVWLAESPTSAPVAPTPTVLPTPAPIPTAPVTPAPAPAPVMPPPAAITPISGLSVAFGDTIDKVRAAYNIRGDTKTDCSDSSPCFMLDANGLTFFFNHDSQLLYEIRADAPFSGSIEGVRIGEALDDLLTRLGQPTSPPNDGYDPPNKMYAFLVHGQGLSCEIDDAKKVVTTIFLFGQ